MKSVWVPIIGSEYDWPYPYPCLGTRDTRNPAATVTAVDNDARTITITFGGNAAMNETRQPKTPKEVQELLHTRQFGKPKAPKKGKK